MAMNGWDDDKLALAYEPDAADAADAAEWLQHVDDTYDCPHCGGEGNTWKASCVRRATAAAS